MPVSSNVSHHPKFRQSSCVALYKILPTRQVENSDHLVAVWKVVKPGFVQITSSALRNQPFSKQQLTSSGSKSHVCKSAVRSMTILAFCGRLESIGRSFKIRAERSTGLLVCMQNSFVTQASAVRHGYNVMANPSLNRTFCGSPGLG